MRKTVHEWLETHDQGRQIGKKRRSSVRPTATPDVAPIGKKKKVAKKSVRKRVKRKPK